MKFAQCCMITIDQEEKPRGHRRLGLFYHLGFSRYPLTHSHAWIHLEQLTSWKDLYAPSRLEPLHREALQVAFARLWGRIGWVRTAWSSDSQSEVAWVVFQCCGHQSWSLAAFFWNENFQKTYDVRNQWARASKQNGSIPWIQARHEFLLPSCPGPLCAQKDWGDWLNQWYFRSCSLPLPLGLFLRPLGLLNKKSCRDYCIISISFCFRGFLSKS